MRWPTPQHRLPGRTWASLPRASTPRLKVTGEARYASDFPVSNPAFAYLVTSTIAKGRITALDLAEARAVPGVLDILTHENTGDLKAVAFGSASTSTQQLGPEIDHDGQIVAVVLADTFEAAREAARKVRVTYAAATPSATFGAQGLTEDDATKVSERIKEAPSRRRRRGGAGGGRRRHRCGICDAHPAPQSDRALHHDLRLARQPADHL